MKFESPYSPDFLSFNNSISDEELAALMQAIKNRYGLDFTNYEKGSLKRGIVRLMMKNKMESLLELWSRVLKDRDFFMTAIDDLLVNLTELFRNPDVWIQIRDNLLDEMNKSTIRIWHAGCSTGEEVYTMAIVLEDKKLLGQTTALATDLSDKALKRAKNGDYSLILLKQYLNPFLKFFPNRKIEDFFDYKDFDAYIKPKYSKHIKFQKHNLVHDPSPGKFDMIFCRNVMIYFDDLLKEKVLRLIHESLADDGYFIIGYYDIMPDIGKTLFDLYDVRTRVYKKKKVK